MYLAIFGRFLLHGSALSRLVLRPVNQLASPKENPPHVIGVVSQKSKWHQESGQKYHDYSVANDVFARKSVSRQLRTVDGLGGIWRLLNKVLVN